MMDAAITSIEVNRFLRYSSRIVEKYYFERLQARQTEPIAAVKSTW
jgi:hypothetical protein